MIDLPMMQQESSRTITRNDLMVSSSLGNTQHTFADYNFSSRHVITGVSRQNRIRWSCLFLSRSLNKFPLYDRRRRRQYLPLSRPLVTRRTNVCILLLFLFNRCFSLSPSSRRDELRHCRDDEKRQSDKSADTINVTNSLRRHQSISFCVALRWLS